MSDAATLDAYGVLIEPATVRIQRLLPGSVERLWAYMTQSDLRRQWLAAGPMDLVVGGEVELVWRNDELSHQVEQRPDGIGAEDRLKSQVTRVEPPHLLAFGWDAGDVTFELAPRGGDVLLTITHRRLPDRKNLLSVSAGWHAHLDILAARMAGREPGPFWSNWTRLREDYDGRLAE